jgi:uncharacterized membrane protein
MHKSKWSIIALRAALVVAAIAASFSFLYVQRMYFNEFGTINASQGNSEIRSAYGQFGDFFGGTLNPVLAFMSFIAILFTISFQMSALQETREEIQQSRSLAEEQKSHFESEAKKTEIMQALRQFENEYKEIIDSRFPKYEQFKCLKEYIESLYICIKTGFPMPEFAPEALEDFHLTPTICRRCGFILTEID